VLAPPAHRTPQPLQEAPADYQSSPTVPCLQAVPPDAGSSSCCCCRSAWHLGTITVGATSATLSRTAGCFGGEGAVAALEGGEGARKQRCHALRLEGSAREQPNAEACYQQSCTDILLRGKRSRSRLGPLCLVGCYSGLVGELIAPSI